MRTTAKQVAVLVGITTPEDTHPFIEAANSLVTEVCAVHDYTDSRLELIERWLAAHFWAIRNPTAQSESAGGASESYEGRADMYFSRTRYGQQALLLDTKGGLAALQQKATSGRMKVGAAYMGRISPNSDLYPTTSDMDLP